MITISTTVFWVLIAFSTIMIFHLCAIVFFPGKDFASDMVNYYEDFWEEILPGVIIFIISVVAIVLLPIGYVVTNMILSKSVKATLLANKKTDRFMRIFLNQRRFIKKMSEEELEEFHSVINGNILFMVIGRKNIELMRKVYNNKIYWQRVSMYINDEILNNFADRLDWDIVLSSNHLPKEKALQHEIYIDWQSLVENQKITEAVFFEYADRIPFNAINTKKNPWANKYNHSDRLKLFLKLKDNK